MRQIGQLLEALVALGVYYYMGYNDYTNALKHLESAIEQQPRNTEALYYEGCVYRRAGKWKEAKEFL